MRKNKNKTSVFLENLPYLCVLAVIVSFAGWVGENIATLIGSRKIDSRFHLLPFISPYGLIVILLYAAFRDVDRATFFGKPLFKKDTVGTRIWSNLYCLVVITAAVFVGELIVGNLWEKGVRGYPLGLYQSPLLRYPLYLSFNHPSLRRWGISVLPLDFCAPLSAN